MSRGRRNRAASSRGQASVEFALALPVLAVVVLIVMQVVVVMRDGLALTAAARAGARRAIVEPTAGAVRDAAVSETGLVGARMTVSLGGDTSTGGRAVVTLTYRAPTDVPVVGRFTPDVTLTERLTVLVE